MNKGRFERRAKIFTGYAKTCHFVPPARYKSRQPTRGIQSISGNANCRCWLHTSKLGNAHHDASTWSTFPNVLESPRPFIRQRTAAVILISRDIMSTGPGTGVGSFGDWLAIPVADRGSILVNQSW